MNQWVWAPILLAVGVTLAGGVSTPVEALVVYPPSLGNSAGLSLVVEP